MSSEAQRFAEVIDAWVAAGATDVVLRVEQDKTVTILVGGRDVGGGFNLDELRTAQAQVAGS